MSQESQGYISGIVKIQNYIILNIEFYTTLNIITFSYNAPLSSLQYIFTNPRSLFYKDEVSHYWLIVSDL